MKRLIPITLLLVSSAIIYANPISPITQSRENTESQQKQKKKVQIDPFGYILLPESYKAYRDKVWVDVWYGRIESQQVALRIKYSGGLVQTPFEVDTEKFQWIKTEKLSDSVIKYGLKQTGKTGTMAANIGGLNFTAEVKSESDKGLFLEIVRSYKRGKCKDCQ